MKRHLLLVICVVLSISFSSCEKPPHTLVCPGVSRELAILRKEQFKEIEYQLFFQIPENKQHPVTGQVEISLSLAKKQAVIIDFKGQKESVSLVTLNGTQTPFELKDEHIIIPKDLTNKGTNRIGIAFTPANQSLNRSDEFLYTLLVPDRARTLFPCFDQPDLKALFTLSLEIPLTWQAVTNAAVQTADSLPASGRKTILFKQTEPLSTYLFSFVAGKLKQEVHTRAKRSISIYHRETDLKKTTQCAEIASEVFDALEWMEKYTAIPYPFAKYDLIILPGFQYGGMEHTGATLYADNRMFLNEQPTLNERMGRSSLIAHEVAHLWFGDYVTMNWFDDVWIKEVFANLFASQIIEPMYPEVNHQLNFLLNYFPAAYSEDHTKGAAPIKQTLNNLKDAGLIYSSVVYNKSPIMMSYLVKKMGEDNFHKGICEYLNTYAYGNASWNNLIAILNKYTSDDLITWGNQNIESYTLPQALTSIDKSTNNKLTTSITTKFQANNFSYLTIKENGEKTHFAIPENNRFTYTYSQTEDTKAIIYNPDGDMYGCFPVDSAALIYYRDSLATFNDITRASILINLYELQIIANPLVSQIPTQTYLDLAISHLPKEINPLIFNMLLKNLSYLHHSFPIKTKQFTDMLWNITTKHNDPQYRLQAFRQYIALVESAGEIERLYTLWKHEEKLANCAISEADRINLSYILALRLPQKANEIVNTQLSRLVNPDRIRQYQFISPAVSPRKEIRDSVFAALLQPQNRRVEPWAASALSYLNHRSRQQEAINYIRPALDKLQEIQQTGDIFFPSAWLNALFNGHCYGAATDTVTQFLNMHPDYPPLLKQKINHRADHLYKTIKGE